MFFKQPDIEEQKRQILKAAEAFLGDRERTVEQDRKTLRAQWARLNECLNFVSATLTDAGHPKTAEMIVQKVKGTWSEGER
jgi:hypothetical protein